VVGCTYGVRMPQSAASDGPAVRRHREHAGATTGAPDPRVQPPPLNEGTELLSLIGRAYRWGRRRMEQVLRAHGVTDAQFHILLALSQEPGLSGIEVAARVFITPQAAHAALATLQGKGLVARDAERARRRTVRTVLTDDGADVLNRCLVGLTEMGVEMGERLPGDERRVLITLLGEYVAAMTAARDTADDSKS
jgi:DNA-binding MarR family transcriptional regulator